MDRLEVCELVVVGIDTYAEEEAGIATVDDLVVPELSPEDASDSTAVKAIC